MSKNKIKKTNNFFKKKPKSIWVNSINLQDEIWDKDNPIKRKAEHITKLKA
jgi:hypothetical protein